MAGTALERVVPLMRRGEEMGRTRRIVAAFFGGLALMAPGCANMDAARYVYQDGEFGVVGIPRNTDHWPTFNVADVAICIGVILMAIDMFTARRGDAYTPAPLRVPVDELLTTPPSDSAH